MRRAEGRENREACKSAHWTAEKGLPPSRRPLCWPTTMLETSDRTTKQRTPGRGMTSTPATISTKATILFVTIIEYLGAVAVYKDEMRMPKKARDSINSFGESPPCPLSYVAGDGQKLERTPPNDKLPENFGPDSLDGIGIERGSQHVVCVQGLRITGPCSLLIRGRKCSGRSDPLGECEGWIVGVSCGEAREVSVHHGVKDRGQQTEMHG